MSAVAARLSAKVKQGYGGETTGDCFNQENNDNNFKRSLCRAGYEKIVRACVCLTRELTAWMMVRVVCLSMFQ